MPKIRTRLIFSILIIISAFFAFNVYWFVFQRATETEHKGVVKIEELLDPSEILVDYSTDLSPNKQFYSFITITDEGMRNQTLWVSDIYGENVKYVEEPSEYKYYSTPIWNEDSKLAYIKYFPFEIYVYDPVKNESELVFSQIEEREEDTFFMEIGYLGKIPLRWENRNTLVFENTYYYPSREYSVDINRKKVTVQKSLDEIDILEDVKGSLQSYSKIYGQRSEKWADEQLGSCVDETLGSAGCAIASLSMAFDKLGVEVNPSELNIFLRENNEQGYIDDCNVMWFIAQNYNPLIKLKGVYFGNFDFEKIIYELNQGNSVIVGFDKVAFSEVGHWVHVTGFNKTQFENAENDAEKMEAFTVGDPWTEEEKTLRYFGETFNSIVVYESAVVEKD